MHKIVFLIAFGMHLLGDFYLQTETLAEKKNRGLCIIMIHNLIYGIPFLAFVFIMPLSWNLIWGILLIIVTHGLIDIVKNLIQKKFKYNQKSIFIIDQLLHLACLFAITRGLSSIAQIHLFLADKISSIAIGVFIITIMKPANVIFRKIVRDSDTISQHSKEPITTSISNAGRMIGNMERRLITIALIAGQYTGIAFVLAAKTLARHKQLEEPSFAEYYLVGTLYSILYTILMYIFIVYLVLQ